METTYLRNIINLHRSKIVFVTAILLLVSLKSFSQRNTYQNLPEYDDRKLHYGFLMGLNSSGYKLNHSQEFVESDSVSSVFPVYGSGFNLGFILNYRLSDFLDARLLPTVAFYNNSMQYNYLISDDNMQALFELSVIELPLMIKYKSMRRKNNRLYIIGGIKPAVRVGSRSGDKSSNSGEQIEIKRLNLSIEYGFGLDHYFPLFKFAPEIRFSYGLLNVLNNQDNFYSNQIDSMTTFTTTFLILFE